MNLARTCLKLSRLWLKCEKGSSGSRPELGSSSAANFPMKRRAVPPSPQLGVREPWLLT